jgi:hypothetical protein
MMELTITHQIDVIHNNGMQWDVAFRHAPDAKRYVYVQGFLRPKCST